jgi:hypothetical protein
LVRYKSRLRAGKEQLENYTVHLKRSKDRREEEEARDSFELREMKLCVSGESRGHAGD